jgi:hypothetical protein
MSRKVKCVTRIEHTFTQSFTAAQLREKLKLLAHAKLTVQVPGGGDWSSCELELDNELTLDVEWTEFSQQEHEEES